MKRMITRVIALAMLALAVKTSASIGPPLVKVENMSINTGYFIEMYNTANQSNGQISSYPASMNASVLQVRVTNNKPGAVAYQPCFAVRVYERLKDGSQIPVVCGGLLRSKVVIGAGEVNRLLTAADFEANGAFTGQIDQTFRNQLEADFKGTDPAQMQKVVTGFLQRTFEVCLIPFDCMYGLGVQPDGSCSAYLGADSACGEFRILAGQAGADASVAMIIAPHNNAVDSKYPMFVWTPAQKKGLAANQIGYILELLDDEAGSPVYRVPAENIGAGNTFYQWKPGDFNLELAKKYWWRVVSVDSFGAPFGGPGNRGWNVKKWLMVSGTQRATLPQLHDAVMQAAAKDSAVRDALEGFTIKAAAQPTDMSDPALTGLVDGSMEIISIKVRK